ncbi:low specificity L-threonine aldolase [Sphingomonas sp. HHU CXW]|uniref:Low specificity L-threonine aldolase n=1 Tax=Sphingomonas hominis TaxID=2741495 RepID=A0ABX2JHT8_9SPHN|nr:beta-eliminating lyase-related protein [Sphingomonas hominis]NTS65379.1 low specificity L-threonine aldolase [Sphingomonas hominis]
MRFFSDNAAPVHPAVMRALSEVDTLDTAYDGDRWSKQLDGRLSHLFETDVRAFWVPSGTAANCLALAAICPPHGSVVCHRDAHIQNDECGAPEFYTHGAKLLLADGDGAKVTPETLEAVLNVQRYDIHQQVPSAISITNQTEYGRAYTADEVAAIGAVARARGLHFHMDGARFANAVVATGASPADLTWRGGVDVLSFGFVKNGGMNAEALVFFRPELADATVFRRKRAGLLLSKGRYLAAQILAMLDNDLWLDCAHASNDGAQLIAAAAGERLIHPADGNEVFLRVTADEAASLRAKGFDFYDWGPGEARLVVSWDQRADDIRPLAEAIAAL